MSNQLVGAIQEKISIFTLKTDGPTQRLKCPFVHHVRFGDAQPMRLVVGGLSAVKLYFENGIYD